jgi:hypothetical protein
MNPATLNGNGVASRFDADRLTFGEAGSSSEARRWADSTQRSRRQRVTMALQSSP